MVVFIRICILCASKLGFDRCAFVQKVDVIILQGPEFRNPETGCGCQQHRQIKGWFSLPAYILETAQLRRGIYFCSLFPGCRCGHKTLLFCPLQPVHFCGDFHGNVTGNIISVPGNLHGTADNRTGEPSHIGGRNPKQNLDEIFPFQGRQGNGTQCRINIIQYDVPVCHIGVVRNIFFVPHIIPEPVIIKFFYGIRIRDKLLPADLNECIISGELGCFPGGKATALDRF